jgi:hypothetical protein
VSILNKNVKKKFYIKNILVNCFAFLMKADQCGGGSVKAITRTASAVKKTKYIYKFQEMKEEMK